MKGLHLSLNAWRIKLDTKTRWRLQYPLKDEDGNWMTSSNHPKAPKTVNQVVRFPFDM